MSLSDNLPDPPPTFSLHPDRHQMDKYTARQVISDSEMRQALWEWLMAHRTPEGGHDGIPLRPSPIPPSDDRIREDLERILLPKRKRFLGLF